ncbi:hypothetical protein [Qipengyuania sp. DGS5-3]|uniref:hypothetical protein n=1 Tax=Qipengyuania sp. DGS5-3 TaxID=3349632 RepID=UPI0036D35709
MLDTATTPLIILVTSMLSGAPNDQAAQQTHADPQPIELWRGLEAGMEPVEAADTASMIEGIKRTKVINQRKPEKSDRVRVTHIRDAIAIGDLPFRLALKFRDSQLEEVVLGSQNQCGEQAESIAARLTQGLKQKYPESIYEDPMRRIDVLEAYRDSAVSGEKQSFTSLYANDTVAVSLTFAFEQEEPPLHPGYGSKLAISLYRLARTQYDQRRSECSGTGHRRVDVLIQYMTRERLTEAMEQTTRIIKEEQDELAKQL